MNLKLPWCGLLLLLLAGIMISSGAAPAQTVNVTFRVNMRVQILKGNFKPDSDFVRITGSYNNWLNGSSTDTLKATQNDSIYRLTVPIKADTLVAYKYIMNHGGNLVWDDVPGGGNRNTATGSHDTTLGVDWFSFDSVYVFQQRVGYATLWSVDMRVYQQLGWFRPSETDSVRLRGVPNNWHTNTDPAVNNMEHDPEHPTVYTILTSDSAFQNDSLPYKYFMQIDSVRGVARWGSDYKTHQDDFRYELPYDRGGGNRELMVNNGGQIPAPNYFFGSLPPEAVLSNTDTVNVVFQINMNPAKNFTAGPFDPARDSAFIRYADRVWYHAVGDSTDSTHAVKLTPRTPGDSIFVGTQRVIGPITSGIQYHVYYSQPGGSRIEQAGGLGAYHSFITQYIHKTGGAWPKQDTLALITWQHDAPHFVEPPPFDIISGVQSLVDARPVNFALAQNYPNPFNPTTNIRYDLTSAADVKLIVYDLLGREVATLVNARQLPGAYVVDFRAGNLASGVYYYRLSAGLNTVTRKMLLVR